jgi:SAM-dependent methyltransferase
MQSERRRGWLARPLKKALQFPYTIRYGSILNPRPSTAGRNRLLDIGCGSGLLLREMSRLGWEVWGIEPDEAVARSVVRRLGLSSERIFLGGAEFAQFPAESFDLVTMSHVLEHLHDPQLVLRNVHRWLRPHGKLRILVPNVGSLESGMFGRFWFGLEVPRHLYHFDPATLYRLLGECGFAIERLVPQFQSATLSGSLSFVLGHVLGRRGAARHSQLLYYATLPFAAVLLGLGNSAAIDVTAQKRDR